MQINGRWTALIRVDWKPVKRSIVLTSLKSLTFENYFLFSQLALFCELHRIRDRGRVYEKSKQSQNKSIAINIDSWHDLVGTHIQFIWPLVNAGAFKSPAGAVSLASSIRHTYKTCQTVSIHIHVRVYWIISFMGSKYPKNRASAQSSKLYGPAFPLWKMRPLFINRGFR